MNYKTTEEYKSRVDVAIDYIQNNVSSDITLQTLSNVTNYSPFHLQKVFKQVTGETPKQYLIKLKLETALHSMVVYQHKSIHEIAMDCGFSSPAVFSRAIKNHFGVAPQKLRSLSLPETHAVLEKLSPKHISFTGVPGNKLTVRIVKKEAIRGIYVIAPFDDARKIPQAFKNVSLIAGTNDLSNTDSRLHGIINLHQSHIYKAFISLPPAQFPYGKLNEAEIKAGKYAAVKVHGAAAGTLKAARTFFHSWLPGSGYRIADTIGFETLNGDPCAADYDKLERELFIPVEPA